MDSLKLEARSEAPSLVRTGLLILAGAVLTALAAQIRIPLPFTPVPITLQTLAVMLVAAHLAPREAALSQLVYLGAGLGGLPVFAIAGGASLGYLVAFPLAAALISAGLRLVPNRLMPIVSVLIAGKLVVLLIGTAWLKTALGLDVQTAVALGVTPFLLGGAVKIGAAAAIVRSSTRSTVTG